MKILIELNLSRIDFLAHASGSGLAYDRNLSAHVKNWSQIETEVIAGMFAKSLTSARISSGGARIDAERMLKEQKRHALIPRRQHTSIKVSLTIGDKTHTAATRRVEDNE